METKNVIYELRAGKGMSQDELAEKLFVTRQAGLISRMRDAMTSVLRMPIVECSATAVSRWENGETVPNTETLKHWQAAE